MLIRENHTTLKLFLRESEWWINPHCGCCHLRTIGFNRIKTSVPSSSNPPPSLTSFSSSLSSSSPPVDGHWEWIGFFSPVTSWVVKAYLMWLAVICDCWLCVIKTQLNKAQDTVSRRHARGSVKLHGGVSSRNINPAIELRSLHATNPTMTTLSGWYWGRFNSDNGHFTYAAFNESTIQANVKWCKQKRTGPIIIWPEDGTSWKVKVTHPQKHFHVCSNYNGDLLRRRWDVSLTGAALWGVPEIF